VLPSPLQEEVAPLTQTTGKGSTDVGDISWKVPTAGLRVASFCDGSPGHSWQNVASIGSSIGEKGLIVAAKTLGSAAIDLFEHPELVAEAKADFDQRTKDLKYTTLIPEGQKAPAAIR
jgi:aminobenzoyl-glutamate utilization protein B